MKAVFAVTFYFLALLNRRDPFHQRAIASSRIAELRIVTTEFVLLEVADAPEDALRFLRFLAALAHAQQIHFLWRPFLTDANDDMILELAFAAGCRYIVTHNMKDFHGSEQLGITAITPREFLKLIRNKT